MEAPQRADLIGSIEADIDSGRSLDEVDQEIRNLGLPVDEAGALSLHAWAWCESAKPNSGLASLAM